MKQRPHRPLKAQWLIEGMSLCLQGVNVERVLFRAYRKDDSLVDSNYDSVQHKKYGKRFFSMAVFPTFVNSMSTAFLFFHYHRDMFTLV